MFTTCVFVGNALATLRINKKITEEVATIPSKRLRTSARNSVERTQTQGEREEVDLGGERDLRVTITLSNWGGPERDDHRVHWVLLLILLSILDPSY